MNFNVVILLSLLSFTSLVTSPAMSMKEEDEDYSSHSSTPLPHATSPTAEQNELEIFLSKKKYPEAFASLRRDLPVTCSDEEIVKFLLSSNGYLKYDTLSLSEKKWVSARIAAKKVDIVDTTLKGSTPPATAATADPEDVTSTTLPAKPGRDPLRPDLIAKIDAYGEKIKEIGNFNIPKQKRTLLATKVGNSEKLSEQICIMTHLALDFARYDLITLDCGLTTKTLEDAELIAADKSTSEFFKVVKTRKKFKTLTGINSKFLLTSVATIVRDLVEKNPEDTEAATIKNLLIKVLNDQGTDGSAALAGRMGYVENVAFRYLIKKYNAGK